MRRFFIVVNNCVLFTLFFCSSIGRSNSFDAYRPSVSPDNKSVIFASAKTGNGDLYRLDLESNKVVRLTTGDSFEGWPFCSSDGMNVVFSKGASKESGINLFWADSELKSSRQVTTGFSYDTAPCISSNGENIIFGRASKLRGYSMGGKIWDDWDVYTLNINGSNLVRVTDQSFRKIETPNFITENKIVFSGRMRVPNSCETLYFLNLDSPKRLIAIDITSATSEVLAVTNFIATQPNVSTKAGKIVFVSNRVSRKDVYDYELWTMNLDGTMIRRITNIHSYIAFPTFDPSGNRIYFLSDTSRDKSYDLMSCDVEGKDIVTLYKGIR